MLLKNLATQFFYCHRINSTLDNVIKPNEYKTQKVNVQVFNWLLDFCHGIKYIYLLWVPKPLTNLAQKIMKNKLIDPIIQHDVDVRDVESCRWEYKFCNYICSVEHK